MAMSKALKAQFLRGISEANAISRDAGNEAARLYRAAKHSYRAIDFCREKTEREKAKQIVREYSNKICGLIVRSVEAARPTVTQADLLKKRIRMPVSGRVGTVTQYRAGKDGESDYVYVRLDEDGKSVKLPRMDWNHVSFV